MGLGRSKPVKDKPLRVRQFTTTIRNVNTFVVYNDLKKYCFIYATQQDGHTASCKIRLKQPPPADITSDAGFSIAMVEDYDGFQNAARLIALRLSRNEALYIHLTLTNFEMVTIEQLIDELLENQ